MQNKKNSKVEKQEELIIKVKKNMKQMYCSMAALSALVMLAAGCGRQEASKTLPVKVKVMNVEPVAVTGGQDFSGTVEESSGSTLSFPVAGTVRQIRVEAGQRVAKGELIAALDEDALQSKYDADAAALEQAEDACRRMKQLHDNNSLPEMQWVEVQSRLKQARSAARISKKNLDDGRLYAPFAGVVSEKGVEVGQNVMPGTPVAKLVTVSQVKVSISVPENEISRIGMGQPVSVTVSALDGKVFSGKVVEKGIAANPLSRSYTVKALVDNPSGELMPGMLCTLNTGGEDAGTAIMLPASVIQTDEQNQMFVWVSDNGKARKRIIRIGRLEKSGVQVVSGLSSGESVIVEGQQKVSEGMDVTLM